MVKQVVHGITYGKNNIVEVELEKKIHEIEK